MREAFESFYEDISGHKPYWCSEMAIYSPKIAQIAWKAWQAALQHAGQPIAWMFQHEDTGRTTSVALGEAEGFAELNPRWQKVCPLYATPQPAVPEGYMLVSVDDIKRLKFYLEPYDDIKPRDWGTDKQNLRRAHELLYALLSAGKETKCDTQ
jgi:hypothetical protein